MRAVSAMLNFACGSKVLYVLCASIFALRAKIEAPYMEKCRYCALSAEIQRRYMAFVSARVPALALFWRRCSPARIGW